MKKFLKKATIFFLLSFIVLSPIFVLAQTSNSGGGTYNPPANNSSGISSNIKITNPFKQDTIPGLIRVLVNEIILPIGVVLAAVMIIYSGFLYVTARGDTAQIKNARDAFMSAVIGTAILLGAWVISEAIQATINSLRK